VPVAASFVILNVTSIGNVQQTNLRREAKETGRERERQTHRERKRERKRKRERERERREGERERETERY
jgi:hypothetical protein